LYVVLITSRKLHHYFEFYKITVVSEFLLGDILRNKEANGCIIKWAAKLCCTLMALSTLKVLGQAYYLLLPPRMSSAM
jgi:hypothetical protein